jgi:hypothetical protein
MLNFIGLLEIRSPWIRSRRKTQAQVIIYITDPYSEQATKHLSSSALSCDSDKNESQDEEISCIRFKSLEFIELRMGETTN